MGRIQFQSPQMFWIAILALAAAILAMGWLYHWQMRRAPNPWRWILPMARLLGLGALAISLLRPTLQLNAARTPQPQRPLLAILVDQSASMSAVDRGKSNAQLIQLASALHLLPLGLREVDLSDLRKGVDDLSRRVGDLDRAQSELEYARLSGRGIESAEAHRRQTFSQLTESVEQVASDAPTGLDDLIRDIGQVEPNEQIDQILQTIDAMQASADEQLYAAEDSIRQICDELGHRSRLELVDRALSQRTGLLDRLNHDWDVDLFGFSDTTWALGDSLNADGNRSDLSEAVGQVQRTLGAQRRQPAAIVVLGDGRTVRSSDAPVSARTSSNVPIVAVNVASQTRDVSLAQLWLPALAYVDETITPRVDVAAVDMDGALVRVVVQLEGQTYSADATIDGPLTHVQLPPVVFRSSGAREVTGSVTLLQPNPELEASTRNNAVRRLVKVVGEKIRVGLIAGSVTRDFQQLRSTLRRTPGIVVTEEILPPGNGLKCTPAELAEQDVLVFCDVAATALSAEHWDAVSRLLSERGGSTLLIAPDPSTLATYAGHPVASAMVPWRGESLPTWRDWPGEDPVFRAVPSSAETFDSLRLSNDTELNRVRWNQLSPLFRVQLLPPLRSNLKSLLVERDSGNPVLLEAQGGAGRALYLGIDELWRWTADLDRLSDDQSDLPDRIWQRIIRHAASEPYLVGDETLALDATPLWCEEGDDLSIRARLRSASGRVDQSIPSVGLYPAGTPTAIATAELTQLSDVQGQYTAQIPNLSTGDYTLRLSAENRAVELPIKVHTTDEAELRDVSGDPAELQRVAGSRGQVINLEEIGSLPARLAELRDAEPRFTELRLWDSPYLFLFVLGCLGLEWAMRKQMGLA